MNRLFVLLVGFLLSTVSSGAGGELSPWELEMARAREAKRNVAFSDAARHLSQAFDLSRSPLDEATTYLEFADLIVERLRYPLVEPHVLSGLSTRLSPRERAEKYYRRAIRLSRKAGGRGAAEAIGLRTRATNNLSALLIETGQHKRAEKLLRSSLSEVDGADRAVYLYNLALAIEGRGKDTEAFQALLEAAGAETGSRSTLELVENRLRESEELQKVELLRAALDVALARGERDFAAWVVTRLLQAEREGASLTAFIRYLAKAEVSASELRGTWIPKLEPMEDRLSSEGRFLWGVVRTLFEEPPSNQLGSCNAPLTGPVSAAARAALEELVQVRAARAYRSGDSGAALCLYERLQSLNPENERAAVYALTLLSEEGAALDPAGSRLLALIEGHGATFASAEVLLAQGDALDALARRTGDRQIRQRADETWRRGLNAGAAPEMAAILEDRLSHPISPELWSPKVWDRAVFSPRHVDVGWPLPAYVRNPGTTFWKPAAFWPLATDTGGGIIESLIHCAPGMAIGLSGCSPALPLTLRGMEPSGIGVPAFGFRLPPPWAPDVLLIQHQEAQGAVTVGIGGCSGNSPGLGGPRASCWLF